MMGDDPVIESRGGRGFRFIPAERGRGWDVDSRRAGSAMFAGWGPLENRRGVFNEMKSLMMRCGVDWMGG